MRRYLIMIVITILYTGCHKSFLSERSDMAKAVPESLADLQAMMDNTVMMNESSKILATIGADEYYYSIAEWNNVGSPVYRNGYLWEKEVFNGEESEDWNYAYRKILYCNIVIEKLVNIIPNKREQPLFEIVKGTALFHRSMAFYDLMQLFAHPYIPDAENKDLGIVLKLTSDIEERLNRSTVDECYSQIFSDLKESIELLPAKVTQKNRPSKFAPMALLSRLYLNMGKYREAIDLAEEIIIQYPLLDYTIYQKIGTNSFPSDANDNSEVIFRSMIRYSISQLNYTLSDDLLSLFDVDDHRSRLFLRVNRDKQVFAGSYYGNTTSFSGLASDEVFLILIECNIHLGRHQRARDLLEKFQKKRYNNVQIDIPDDMLLDALFNERRKQLMFRGLRWEDLRRLNFTLGKNHNIVRPKIEEHEYILEAKSLKYIWPLPNSAVELGGLEQNIR